MNFATNLLRAVGAAAVTVMLMASMPSAHAVEQTWSFSGTLDSGSYAGQSYSGQFSFDDSIGTGYADLNSFSMIFLGTSFNLANALAGSAAASLADGALLGVSYSFEGSALGFSLVEGFSNASESFLAYDVLSNGLVVDGMSGAGSVIYAPVPEPQSYAMLLAGLGLLAFASRRWVK